MTLSISYRKPQRPYHVEDHLYEEEEEDGEEECLVLREGGGVCQQRHFPVHLSARLITIGPEG